MSGIEAAGGGAAPAVPKVGARARAHRAAEALPPTADPPLLAVLAARIVIAARARGDRATAVLRRIPDASLLAVLAAGIVIAALALRSPTDDAFWQVAYGRLMLAQGRLPRLDHFSWTMAGHPVMVTEWLFDLAMGAASAAGPAGAFALALVGPLGLGLIALAVFSRLSRHRAKAGFLALALLLLVSPFETLLPQVASFALFAAVWWVLERARTAGPLPLLLLPPLFALWANVHGTFYGGLALVALDTGLAWWPRLTARRPRAVQGTDLVTASRRAARRRPAHLTFGRIRVRYRTGTARFLPAALAASAAATLLTPYGWRLYPEEIALATSPFHLQHIAEFASPNFHNPFLQWFLLPAILAVLGTALLARRPLPAREVLAALALLGAALIAVRIMPYALVALGALAAATLRGGRQPARPAPWPVAACALAVAIAGVARFPPPAWPPAAGYPAGAAAYVSARRAALPGHGFNTYAWGSYLLWRWQGHPQVYVDSRGDFYDQGTVLSRYLRVIDLTVDPGPYLRQQGIGWALLPRAMPVARVLRIEGWRVAYRGKLAVVLVRPGALLAASTPTPRSSPKR